MKTDHFKYSDAEFLKHFSDFTLQPALFTHEAHLRLAWLYINLYGTEKAAVLISTQIKAFDRKFGDGSKFNKTVTIASVYIVNHFMERSLYNDFKILLEEFPQLKTNFTGLIRSHYKINIFTEKRAKKEYVEPDLLSF